jgi:MFS family permease
MNPGSDLTSRAPQRRNAYTRSLWRLLPFLCVLLLAANIDRAALAYAAPAGMNKELGLDAALFGLISGVFFIGYVLFEVPSSILLQKFGARKWLGRIIITWGLVQAVSAWAPNEWVLGILRVVLGICEAGFSPAVLFYLTLWFPAKKRTWAFGIFFATIPAMSIIGGPFVSGLIQWGSELAMFGLSGWRFMFLVTGIVPVLLGIATLFVLPDSPRSAAWLSAAEKDAIEADLRYEQGEIQGADHASTLQGLKDKRVWILGLAYICVGFAAYTVTFFLPTMVTNFGAVRGTALDPLQVALIVAIPATAGLISALVLSRLIARSLLFGKWILGLTVTGGIGALVVSFSDSPIIMLVGLCLIAVCTGSMPTAVFSMIPKLFATVATAVAIAVVNSMVNIGGFAGPYATGAIIKATGSEALPFVLIAALLIVGGVVMFSIDNSAERLRQEGALNRAEARSVVPAAEE